MDNMIAESLADVEHPALHGLRVLDLTTPLGHMCGKILGDLGADVIKVEPLAGDAGRRRAPFYTDPGGAQHSLFWLSYNNNKRGITLHIESAEGQGILRQLASMSDIVIESFAPGYMDSLGLGHESLRSDNPGLIYTAITPFGQTGPYRDFLASDLEIMASAGIMSLTGYPGETPLRISMPQSEAWTSMYAAMGTMTALHYRKGGGAGQMVDVSAQQACVILCVHAPMFWDFNRELVTREGEYMTGRTITGAKFRAVWPCKDGYLSYIIYGGPAGQKTNHELTKWMDSLGVASDVMKNRNWDKFEVATLTQAEVDEMEAPIGKFFERLTKSEFLSGVVERGMLGYPVASTADILQDDHLAARNFWEPLAVPGRSEPVLFPGEFAKFSEMSCRIRRPAPALGEHNEEVYTGLLSFSALEIERLHKNGIV
ncbi:MAG: CoA transferase [Acidobacteria bacterium]|nr:CoA transferase [Acidobacteriota bacterium]